MGNQILLSPGRIVEGNVYKSSTLGMNGQIKAKPEFYFAVAIAKTDPRIPEIWEAYKRTAQDYYRSHPNVMAAIAKEDFRPYQGFAWKISNGDDADRVGKPGQAGCWIFKFKTTWEIKVVDANNVPINPTLLRTGFWCDVLANLDGNKNTNHQAGLFANPVFVRWLFPGYGEEIQPGPDADKAMGAAPTQLPPGAQQAQRGGMGSGPTGGYSGGNPGAGGGMGGAHPHQAPAHQAHVGQGSAAASPSPAGGPGGWQQPAVNPQSHAHAQANSSPSHAMSGGNPSGHAPGAANMAPHNPTPAGAHAPAAPASAMPAGAHSMPAQRASPTAYPSNSGGPGGQGGMAPPVHGFAHGNPGGQ